MFFAHVGPGNSGAVLLPGNRLLSSQIHTIFMLSIADLVLAVMWVVGGGMWLSGGTDHVHYSRVGCFTVLLITMVSFIPSATLSND
jgi:hypothetical protein